MGVGLAEDAAGAQRMVIGTSEPGGYLRPGVTLAPGETMAPGTGHAEANIVNYAMQNGLRLLEIGATRPICSICAALIEQAGATPVTPLKVVPQ
jgi:filamentous hemagglutinin